MKIGSYATEIGILPQSEPKPGIVGTEYRWPIIRGWSSSKEKRAIVKMPIFNDSGRFQGITILPGYLPKPDRHLFALHPLNFFLIPF